MFGAVKRGKKGASGLWVLVYSAVILSALTANAAAVAGDELHWSTTQNEPEKHWEPVPARLKEAYRLSQMETDPIDRINTAVAMCSGYIKAHPGDTAGTVDAYVILAESYSNLGEYRQVAADRLKAYEQGKAAAQRIIDLAPDRWDGWFWWAANVGRIAQLKGILESMILFKPVERHLFKAWKLAPNSVLVLDGLGLFYREVPWFAGGSLSKSKGYLHTALEIDPHSTLARLDLAETLLKDGDKAQARRELQTIIEEKHPTWPAHYLWWDRPKAEGLLKGIK
ncbi:MAG: tetratricopeptide repeat protein [Deltaproteobacteria bacterium]|nr:tetratricopeptide repeat protein [Deltaproteobacteria bacterium]